MSDAQYLSIFHDAGGGEGKQLFKRATLVVAPVVLLRQWQREIEKMAFGCVLPYMVVCHAR
jgi:hypothetical protein